MATVPNHRELIIQEMLKCKTDYIYAIKKYFKVEHPTKGLIPFDLYQFQERTLQELITHRFNIILKSRQMGISTLVASYALMKMMSNDSFKILVIATTQPTAINLVRKVKIMYDKLPSWFKNTYTAIGDNKLEFSLSNGSTIQAVSSNPDAARSHALSLLIIDEAAFVDKMDDIWTAAQLTLAEGGSAILLSTPNGVGNVFHKLWVQAESGEVPQGLELFNPIKLNWDLHPHRDQKWRDQQTLTLGAKQASQECDCSFITSGHTVVDGEILEWYQLNMVKDPLEKRGPVADYWIWSYSKPNVPYVTTVDVGRGDGSDNSVINVFDADKMEQVAEWSGQIDTRELGRMAVHISMEYNNALLVIDNRNVGWDTVQEVINMKYDNMHYTYKDEAYVDPSKHIFKGWDLKAKRDMTPGLTITSVNRPIMINKLAQAYREKRIIIRSSRALAEMLVFKWINGKPQAQDGWHDDNVMTQAYFLYIRDTALYLKDLGKTMTRKALDHMGKGVYIPKPTPKDEWSIRDGYGNVISTKWLL